MKDKIMLALAAIIIILSLPVVNVNYYIEGEGNVVKRQSMVEIFVEDINNGTFGTGF